MSPLKFPLDIRFKTISISRQFSVEDADGQLVWYTKMKSFKLKEAVTVYADREQTRALYEIHADRVIDVGASYAITDATTHAPIGVLRNLGMKSFWRAGYEVSRDGRKLFEIQEENPWVKVLDSFLGEIPVLGILSGYLLHPSYLAADTTGNAVVRMRKEAAMLEGRFSLERVAVSNAEDEKLLVLALLMTTLLEKRRG
jgi:hypothetical protein